MFFSVPFVIPLATARGRAASLPSMCLFMASCPWKHPGHRTDRAQKMRLAPPRPTAERKCHQLSENTRAQLPKFQYGLDRLLVSKDQTDSTVPVN